MIIIFRCLATIKKISHSIARTEDNQNLIKWQRQSSIKIRLDSKAIENVAIGLRGYSKGIYFKKGTWFLLTKIATAKTFGFKAIGEDGSPYSARFNVQNSVPIAAKFTAMGCLTEKKYS
jgi:hypothetical protein